jgi:hypothetical protein
MVLCFDQPSPNRERADEKWNVTGVKRSPLQQQLSKLLEQERY